LILAAAAVVRLWRLGANGYGNPFYAAAVRSMGASWHNFFFAAFDPGGYMTIDKPPLAFWVQVADARVLGFHPLALLLPSALAGIAAVGVLYAAVRRVFGTGPAAGAALVLTLTPITVATDRFNDPDALLAFLLVVAAWLVIRAMESASWRRLLLAGAVLGLGFMTKSLAAAVPVPALGLAYLVSAPTTLRTRLIHLTAATAVLIVVALGWVVVVDAFPAGSRPLVAGSTTDSELGLSLGSNGVARISGDSNGAPAVGTQTAQRLGEANRFGDIGIPGPRRLVDSPLGGEGGWPLALAVVGLVAGVVEVGRRRGDPRLASWILWGGWLATEGVVLSTARGTFHAYYMTAMMPATAALAGSGGAALVRSWRSRGWTAGLALAAVVGTGLIEYRADLGYHTYQRLGKICLLATVVAALLLAAALLRTRLRPIAGFFLAATLALLCIAPLAWTATVLRHPGVAGVPKAGPPLDSLAAPVDKALAQARAQNQPPSVVDRAATPGGEAVARLIDFLDANHHGERWPLAIPAGGDAAPVILRSGLGVIALDGVLNAPVITVAHLERLINDHQLRFVLLKLPPTGSGTVLQAETWSLAHCPMVPSADWQPPGQPSPSMALLDCSPATGPEAPASP